ncbi:lytic polysaccharide monooxygenase [Shewanella sp. UCD-KL12]|uniref:lytic polysaccharide monooxygenase n=1 Tax=Shewanella sp. UCD-KL12 TaxID=1917163 RepID=UPI0009707A99|nr:lytic polysaccharide monooxygenase [Shewanella sp. UCD-KL12]
MKQIIPLSASMLIVSLVISLLLAADVNAHGYMESPKARQQMCVDDGGYWWPDDGSAIPNLACRAAFLATGTKQLVQNNEFSENVVDYNNLDAVQQAIPNGQLCAGGDSEKSGMDLPSLHWQRTDVTPDDKGQIAITFDAHTPHNPSFWEFYLSNEDFDAATESLSWEKLEHIAQFGDVAVSDLNGRKVYQMDLDLPQGRVGAATLYTRWQREDAAGEGFYNCSDLNIVNETQPVEWRQLAQYVDNGLTANVDDEIWFRLFSAQGDELIFEKLTIDANNQSTEIWAQQLAESVLHLHSDLVQLGVKQSNGDITYSEDLALNKVWTKQAELSFRMDVKSPTEPPNPCQRVTWNANTIYNLGDEVMYKTVIYQAQWWTKNDLPSSSGQWGVWQPLDGCSF